MFDNIFFFLVTPAVLMIDMMMTMTMMFTLFNLTGLAGRLAGVFNFFYDFPLVFTCTWVSSTCIGLSLHMGIYIY